MKYSIGLDYGTNSCRCLIVNLQTGQEVACAVYEFSSGDHGIILDAADNNLARQDPADYINAMQETVTAAIRKASNEKGFNPADIIGIGVDTTGSTPIPVDAQGTPLSMTPAFAGNPNAMAWLWKDHTSHSEAARITELAKKHHPEYLARCGGTYSSEWFFSKILHCLRVDTPVFDAAYTWLECCDFIPAVLTASKPADVKRSRCAAGHKAMFSKDWGGLPAKDFLSMLNPKLGAIRDRLYDETFTIETSAGQLAPEWAKKLSLPAGIPVAVGAIDAHMGAVGSGIAPGRLVKIIGTSSCDMIVKDSKSSLPNIPGICGMVDGSILPGCYGLEAGQSAVGDIFNWFVNYIQPGGKEQGSHLSLTEKAAALKPGQSGLLALDWNNGNRCIIGDQRLTGVLVGQTLHTRPEEIYRALIEATAFGALIIINRFEEYGIKITEVINCGGIAEKNPLLMQIYADVTGREMKISSSSQTCALGSAIAGAVAAGSKAGGFDDFCKAQQSMCGIGPKTYKPILANNEKYQQLYKLYKQLYDAFGNGSSSSLSNVMKELLAIKESSC